MIADSLQASLEDVHRGTSWQIKPEGACKDVRCVPLPDGVVSGDRVDLRAFAERMGMGLVEGDGVWALGPEAGGRALASAEMPEITLPDRNGRPFSLSSLRGTKVFMVAWASW